ncbi:hypothetical protein Scep_004960 [Stephania cephalantha]|uniref:Uncharacterized protein n=1 Tax=Stephania cephalantha TaxID=152367 RepID=A0AAP0KTL2_9MAGN
MRTRKLMKISIEAPNGLLTLNLHEIQTFAPPTCLQPIPDTRHYATRLLASILIGSMCVRVHLT